MHISVETPAQTEERLRKAIRESEFALVNGTWNFEEFTTAEFTSTVNPVALALVRDGERWSQLVPASAFAREMMAVWMFHFPDGADNSGFVGWPRRSRPEQGVALPSCAARTACGAASLITGCAR
jgi:hypothetical protein